MEHSNDEQPDDVVKKDFLQSLDTYYRLKNEYDTNVNQLKNIITKNNNLSIKEKRESFQNISSVIKCINCNRVGGTVFQEYYDKEREGRVVTAKCGVKLSPCILDIEINIGAMENISEELTNIQTKLNEQKHAMMRIKNDVLFGYKEMNAELAKEITELQDGLKESLEEYESRLELYVAVYDRPYDKETIEKLEIDIYNNIQHIRSIMTDYEREKNTQLIHDAVSVFITDLIPKTTQLRNTKYAIVETQTDSKTNTCILTEKKMDIESTEFDFSVPGVGVVKMITGLSDIQAPKKTSKSSKKTSDQNPYSNTRSSEYKLNTNSNDNETQEKDKEQELDIINLDDEAIQL